ncbi:DNAJC27 [Scenedesmus sp. PABB004]|nr:DNAJC27 [Scenedesmus sp. PABB004]
MGPRGRVLRLKVLSMGDTGVGKSCLIKRYCEEKFVSRYIPTIGVDYGVKPVPFGDHEVRVNLWDLAGPPEYAAVRTEFYRDGQAALLVYDACSRPSFEALPRWLDEAAAHGAPPGMVSAASGRGVRALFASLFAVAIRAVPHADAGLAASAASQALAAMQAEGLACAD